MAESGSNNGTGERISTIPDFSQEVLAHLQVQSDDFELHVKAFLEAPDGDGRRLLCDDIHRFRNTLVLLDKKAAVFVAEELLALLAADEKGELNDQAELARVLLTAADQLSTHVAVLQRDPTIDSALPLLPLVNDSRACRGEILLSDVLILAAGIELPKVKRVPPDSPESESGDAQRWPDQRLRWVNHASANHSVLAQRLLVWWSNSGDTERFNGHLNRVAEHLRELADFTQSGDYLASLTPLYQAASLVAEAIGRGELTDGPALRSLYAQLERNMYRCAQVSLPEDLLPGDLLRNFLYYVAQIESDHKSAIALRRRFRLDRVRQAARVNDTQGTPTIGVGYHLSRAIRSSIAQETDSLREWLEKPPEKQQEELPKLVRLRVRLAQLEPVLTLMGALEALSCLQGINAGLKTLDEELRAQELFPGADEPTLKSETLVHFPRNDEKKPESINEVLQHLAESLLTLDVLLDQNARNSVRKSATPAVSSVKLGDAIYVDMAVDACLREARESMQQIADVLSELLPTGGLSTGRCHAVTQQLQLVDLVLQILPLPEVSPLLQGLGDVLTKVQLRGRQLLDPGVNDGHTALEVHEEIATLLVSIDYYLGCVLQPQASASQLLLDAEDALHNARALLGGDQQQAHTPDSEYDTEGEITPLLDHWDSLGGALSSYQGSVVADSESVSGIGAALKCFLNDAEAASSQSLQLLASSASAWFDRTLLIQQKIDEEQLSLLEEVHGIIPQLIDQWLGGSEQVRGFDDLIDKLDTAEVSLGLQDLHTLTLNVDDDLLLSSKGDADRLSMDNTLDRVFHYECLGHLEVLESSVDSALQPVVAPSLDLPTEQMLRALHALAGSAQTVDAPHLVAIVQPLQRAALARQRQGFSFDEAETQYIGELLAALRARLNNLTSDESVPPDVIGIEGRLSEFVASVIPGSDAIDSGLGLASNVRSLDDVFAEEAHELLDRFRIIVHSKTHGVDEVRAALSLLHTLKGSARMAGRVNIANQAHALESELQQLEDQVDQQAILKNGYAALSGLISQASAQVSVVAATREPTPEAMSRQLPNSMLVSDTAFDGLLDLATDVTVNQARLSDELSRLREVYQDIETTAARWRALSQSQHLGNSSAASEMLADLEAARVVMREALHQAEREQQQASRAAASLQQSLIRTRLVRVDEIQERLSQAIQDAAESTHRRAQIDIDGGEVTLDRALYRQLQAPLEHLVRNAVVHGIEPENERLGVGKAGVGRIHLSATVDGTDLVLAINDDGRGVDNQALNRLLESRGELPVESHEDVQSALFKSGFTSIDSPTALAGHGLGLAAVQAAVEQMRGRVQFATQLGEGTRITLRIPQRIVVNQAVLVEANEMLFAIPVSQVEAVRMAHADDEPAGRHKPVSLAQLLSQGGTSSVTDIVSQSPAVLVNVGGHALALEVDQVIGYRELVTQALGPQIASLRRYSGGSVLSDGRQVLIVDLNRAVESLGEEPHRPVKPLRESLRPVALVVDDSLTMRVAAESVLLQCGIAVRQSRDGLEALDSLATALPNLIILDIEMPKLDGPGFLRRIRETYADACPPVIVISSRDEEVNRKHMSELGVVRFLAKPYTKAQLQEAIEAAGLRLPDLTIA